VPGPTTIVDGLNGTRLSGSFLALLSLQWLLVCLVLLCHYYYDYVVVVVVVVASESSGTLSLSPLWVLYCFCYGHCDSVCLFDSHFFYCSTLLSLPLRFLLLLLGWLFFLVVPVLVIVGAPADIIGSATLLSMFSFHLLHSVSLYVSLFSFFVSV
jgi:hypothetical protein